MDDRNLEKDPFPTVAAFDAWQNELMGYGTARDKITYAYHALTPRLTDTEISNLYYTDDVSEKLVGKRPEEAFRRGYKLKNPEDESLVPTLLDKAKRLGLDEKMQEAATWGRAYGGALLIFGFVGGGLPTQPLDITRVRDVRFINVIDRRFIGIESYYSDPLAPNYGLPEIYIVSGENGVVSRIHESRVIRFDGTIVDRRKRRELLGWSYSVLQRPYDVMRAFATAFQAAASLTADASQAVFTIKGLFEMIASGQKDQLRKRLELVDMQRSSTRPVLLDSDGEAFSRVPTSFDGLPEMLDRMMMRLASSVDTPVTILMGRSPAGQNATGDSDFQHWYDSIASQQTKEYGPKLQRAYFFLSGGKASVTAEWLPLREPTDAERAAIEKTRAETFHIYIQNGTLFAEEVALAVFGKSSNGVVEIDEKARQRSLQAELEMAEEPPIPAPRGNVPPGGDDDAPSE